MVEMTLDSVILAIRNKGWYKERKNKDHFVQIVLSDGTCVNCYRTGTIAIQGKKRSEIRAAAESLFADHRVSRFDSLGTDADVSRSRVFVVYGHDQDALNDLELLLRRMNLEPVILQNLSGGGATIIDNLEQLTRADFACVLMTPDDEGRRRASEGAEEETLRPRARQNVLLELGMVLARLGTKNVAILRKGTVENPSDIAGLIYLPFKESVKELDVRLAKRLNDAGFSVGVGGLGR